MRFGDPGSARVQVEINQRRMIDEVERWRLGQEAKGAGRSAAGGWLDAFKVRLTRSMDAIRAWYARPPRPGEECC